MNTIRDFFKNCVAFDKLPGAIERFKTLPKDAQIKTVCLAILGLPLLLFGAVGAFQSATQHFWAKYDIKDKTKEQNKEGATQAVTQIVKNKIFSPTGESQGTAPSVQPSSVQPTKRSDKQTAPTTPPLQSATEIPLDSPVNIPEVNIPEVITQKPTEPTLSDGAMKLLSPFEVDDVFALPKQGQITAKLLELLMNKDLQLNTAMQFLPDDKDKISRSARMAIALNGIASRSPDLYSKESLNYVAVGSGALLQDFYNIVLWMAINADTDPKAHPNPTLNIHFIDSEYSDETPILDDQKTKWRSCLAECTQLLQEIAPKYGITINISTYTSDAQFLTQHPDTKIDVLSAIRLPERLPDIQEDHPFAKLHKQIDQSNSCSLFLDDNNRPVVIEQKSEKPVPNFKITWQWWRDRGIDHQTLVTRDSEYRHHSRMLATVTK